MVEGPEHVGKVLAGFSIRIYYLVRDTSFMILNVLLIEPVIALTADILHTVILMFIESGQSSINSIVRKLCSTRVDGMESKKDIDTEKTNTGLPKAKYRHGNGAFVVGNYNLIAKGGQRHYSTKPNADFGVRKSKLNIIELENNKFTGLYNVICDANFLANCYGKIKSKPGNMTQGVDNITLDGISRSFIKDLSKSLIDESFQFKPSRRVNIPKANGKLRPLAIASPRDKIVHEAMRLSLETIFEPIFLNTSHGFRPGRSCHSALKEVSKWNGVTWVIEGDIKSYFDNVDHHILATLLERKVSDQRFIDLYWKLVKAGYVERGFTHTSDVGVPQGSILSPILSNIYLNEFDIFMEKIIDKYSTKGTSVSKVNPAIVKYSDKLNQLHREYKISKDKLIVKEIKQLRLERNKLNSRIRNEIRIRYIRYADDWIVGIIGIKETANLIKELITQFLNDRLKITLNKEKTKITYLPNGRVKFLGCIFTIIRGSQAKIVTRYNHKAKSMIKARINQRRVVFFAPYQEILLKLADKGFLKNYTVHSGNLIPQAITKWIFLDHRAILIRYNSIIRGLLNYYSFVDNFNIFTTIAGFILRHSCAHTLSRKLNLGSRASAFARFGKNLTARSKVKGKNKQMSLSIPKSFTKSKDFKRSEQTNIRDFMATLNYKIETQFAWADSCCICGLTEGVEMHHLKHLRKDGDKPTGFLAIMSSLNRKQIPVCKTCHNKIHAGLYNGIKLTDLWSVKSDLNTD